MVFLAAFSVAHVLLSFEGGRDPYHNYLDGILLCFDWFISLFGEASGRHRAEI